MPIFQIEHGGQTLEIDSEHEPAPADLEAILSPAAPAPESPSVIPGGNNGAKGTFNPNEATLSAYKEPGLLSRAGTAVRESGPATFFLGETKNQQMAREQAKMELRMQAPGLASLLDFHEATSYGDQSNTPIVSLPQLPEITPTEGKPLTGLEKVGAAGAAAYNAAAPAISSFTSPKNIAILIGTAGAGTVAKGIITGLFGATMAGEVIDQSKEAAKVFENPDSTFQERATSVAAPLVTGVFSAMAGLGAVHELRPALSDFLKDKPAPEVVKTLREEATKATDPKEQAVLSDAASKVEDANAIAELNKAGVEIETPPSSSTESVVSQVQKMGPGEFFKWAHEQPEGVSGSAYTEGIAAIGDAEAIQKLKDARADTDVELHAAKADKRFDDASTLTTKRQFFNEAVMAAEHNGSAVGDPRVDAAHKAFNEQKTTQELLTGDNFDKQWKAGGEIAGSENQIVIKDGRVYKRNYNAGLDRALPNHGTLESFNDNLAVHNEIFPETALKFEGMSETPDGPAPVVSQAEVKGVEATPQEVKDFMAAKGFEQYSGSAYVNKEAGLRVGDMKGDNVIKDANGVLHVIDPVIKRIKPEPAKIAEPAVAQVGLGAAAPAEFRPVRESATSLKNAAVDAERKARGAPPLMEVAKKGFGEAWDQAIKAIDENQNVADDLISTLNEKPRATTDVEQAILLHREIDLKNQLDRVTKNLSENIGTEDSLASDRLNRARILDELSTLEEASKAAGTETSRGLNARKLIAKEDYSLAKILTERRAEKGGAKLTDAEIAEVEKQVAETEAAQRALDQHEAQQELDAAVTTPDEAKARIDTLEKEVKAEEKKPEPAPKSKEEAALKQLKTRTQKQIDVLRKKIADGDFSKKAAREPVKVDEEALRLRAELQRTKDKIQETLLKDRIAQRSVFERAQDTFVKWRRGFLLSSPVTLAKLTSAAVQRMVFTPLEELVGAGIGKLIPKIESRASREGGLNVNAEARAITEGITKGMSDAAELLRTGKTNLEVLFGKGREGGVKESDVTPRSIIDLFGQIHGALKAPVKRAEFARSLEKRMAWGIRNGVDVTDPAVQTKLMIQAYKDANRSIFLQDNIVVNAYNRALGALLEKQKATGKPSTAGKILATTAKTLLPIVRVPTNIVAETIQVATGTITGSYRLARTLGREASKISPEEADLILRDLKKGSLGAALLAVGYFNAQNIGGYYQSGQKRSDKDVGYGSVKISGVNVPSYLLHNPLIEALQIGATVRRVADSKFLKKDKDTQGVAAGTLAAALGLVEEVPFVRQQVETAKMLDTRQGPYARGEFVKSLVVPAAVDFTARKLDTDKNGNTIQRKPSTVLQHIETGIPGLRANVPARAGGRQMGQPPPMLKK
jgi:Serine/Threonine/Tyrosine Kinase found in polyvalent proteins